MPIITLNTTIQAPIQRCFDLSRSIDLHKLSTADTHEEAIAGVTSGLIDLNETVTWRAKHLGIYQTLSTKITELESPTFFVDEMISGAFQRFRHEHHFAAMDKSTCMTDIFDYTAPMGRLGKLADLIFLKRYMTKLLQRRNAVIKEMAESDSWKSFLL